MDGRYGDYGFPSGISWALAKLITQVMKNESTDARRYRWLRTLADGTPFIVLDGFIAPVDQKNLTGADLDAYVDKFNQPGDGK